MTRLSARLGGLPSPGFSPDPRESSRATLVGIAGKTMNVRLTELSDEEHKYDNDRTIPSLR